MSDQFMDNKSTDYQSVNQSWSFNIHQYLILAGFITRLNISSTPHT